MKVTFRKIQNNHGRMRDDVIQGESVCRPMLGESFVFTAKPRDSGDIRLVHTSPIIEVIFEEDNFTTFKTFNQSIYSVEVHKDEEVCRNSPMG